MSDPSPLNPAAIAPLYVGLHEGLDFPNFLLVPPSIRAWTFGVFANTSFQPSIRSEKVSTSGIEVQPSTFTGAINHPHLSTSSGGLRKRFRIGQNPGPNVQAGGFTTPYPDSKLSDLPGLLPGVSTLRHDSNIALFDLLRLRFGCLDPYSWEAALSSTASFDDGGRVVKSIACDVLVAGFGGSDAKTAMGWQSLENRTWRFVPRGEREGAKPGARDLETMEAEPFIGAFWGLQRLVFDVRHVGETVSGEGRFMEATRAATDIKKKPTIGKRWSYFNGTTSSNSTTTSQDGNNIAESQSAFESGPTAEEEPAQMKSRSNPKPILVVSSLTIRAYSITGTKYGMGDVRREVGSY